MGESGRTSVTRELERLLNKDIVNKSQRSRNYNTRFASEDYTPNNSNNIFSRFYQRIKDIKNYFIK